MVITSASDNHGCTIVAWADLGSGKLVSFEASIKKSRKIICKTAKFCNFIVINLSGIIYLNL